MTCRRCGKRCQGRYCQSCGRDEHREQSLDTDEASTDKITYECTDCGGRYQAESPGCPHCGHYGGRYAGDDADEPALVTDGGRSLDDYVDLGDMVAESAQSDSSTPDRENPDYYTQHKEPEYLGGALYHRCSLCNAEAVGSHEQVLHDKGCPLRRGGR
jgi:hypothetical protein